MDKRDSCTWRGCKQDAASPHPKGEKVLHPRQLSNLERLPPEIIEFICTELLDGESVINLRNSSSQCRRLVDLALLGKIVREDPKLLLQIPRFVIANFYNLRALLSG